MCERGVNMGWTWGERVLIGRFWQAPAALDSRIKQCSGIFADGEETQEQQLPYVSPSIRCILALFYPDIKGKQNKFRRLCCASGSEILEQALAESVGFYCSRETVSSFL